MLFINRYICIINKKNMWIKINGKPLHTSSIKDISNIDRITTEKLIYYYNFKKLRRHYSYCDGDRIEDTKMKSVFNYVCNNNKSTGNIINYLKNEDGSNNTNNIIGSSFKMDSDKFMFSVSVEIVDHNSEKSNIRYDTLMSKVFDTIEEAEVVHNNLLTKLNEIEMSIINIEI